MFDAHGAETPISEIARELEIEPSQVAKLTVAGITTLGQAVQTPWHDLVPIVKDAVLASRLVKQGWLDRIPTDVNPPSTVFDGPDATASLVRLALADTGITLLMHQGLGTHQQVHLQTIADALQNRDSDTTPLPSQLGILSIWAHDFGRIPTPLMDIFEAGVKAFTAHRMLDDLQKHSLGSAASWTTTPDEKKEGVDSSLIQLATSLGRQSYFDLLLFNLESIHETRRRGDLARLWNSLGRGYDRAILNGHSAFVTAVNEAYGSHKQQPDRDSLPYNRVAVGAQGARHVARRVVEDVTSEMFPHGVLYVQEYLGKPNPHSNYVVDYTHYRVSQLRTEVATEVQDALRRLDYWLNPHLDTWTVADHATFGNPQTLAIQAQEAAQDSLLRIPADDYLGAVDRNILGDRVKDKSVAEYLTGEPGLSATRVLTVLHKLESQWTKAAITELSMCADVTRSRLDHHPGLRP